MPSTATRKKCDKNTLHVFHWQREDVP